MFNMPYETRIGRDVKLTLVESALAHARSRQYQVTDRYMAKDVLILPDAMASDFDDVYFVTEPWIGVPYFTQIIKMPHEWKSDEFVYFIDVRQQTTIRKDETVAFKSSNDKLFTMLRLLLTIKWDSGDTHPFYSAVEFSGLVFAQWITRAIGKVYAINIGNPATQMRITAIAALFHYSQFSNSNDISGFDNTRERTVIASKIAKSAKVPVELAVSIIESVGGYIKDTDEFIKAISEHSENILLENFSTAKLYNALSMTWYGANAGEHSACAVEYVPTLFAMIITAIKDNSYRKTIIGEIVKDNMRNPGVPALLSGFKQYYDIL